MKNLGDVKREFTEHLYDIDKEKLNMMDLKTYAEIVKIMDEIERSGQPSEWAQLMAGFATQGIGSHYKAVDMKGGE